MKRTVWSVIVLVCALLAGTTLLGTGCGGSEASVGDGGIDYGVPSCSADGAQCGGDRDCCSNLCDPAAHACMAGAPYNCEKGGAACTGSLDCCSVACVNGKCNVGACTSDGQACTSDGQCCGGKCGSGTCTPLNTSCKTAGNSCSQNGDCCSKLCTAGRCSIASSFCIQNGDACAQGPDCCGGVCTVAKGQTLGTCGAPPAGPSFCNGGMDGIVCNGCNDCCSRLCTPYGQYGIKVCQPADGCHIDGDLCTKDSDCCGAKGSGLPGDGNVVCDIQPGYSVGICRNPTGCNPEGDVCHYKGGGYACGNSDARADCCAAPGSKSGACVLDKLGVPRCYGGGPCAQAGGQCAFDKDCCGGGHCVPGPNGQLVCQSGCSASSGPCTVDADCCDGLHCYVPQGSTKGTCGAPPPPPPGYDGGTPDAGCALYGQSCAQNADCCNGIPCTGPDGQPCNGGTGCYCTNPVR